MTNGKQEDGQIKIEYEDTALEYKFLLTSRKTGYIEIHAMTDMWVFIFRFSMDFLYEHALNIIHYQATFQSMAAHFDDFHKGTILEKKIFSEKLNIQ